VDSLFLKKIGMHPRKIGMIPGKADPDKKKSFKENKLEPILEEAKQERAVLFVDAAHFVLSAFLGTLWSFARIFSNLDWYTWKAVRCPEPLRTLRVLHNKCIRDSPKGLCI
jgi:hypothetical protein